jgi:hypothetical protein
MSIDLEKTFASKFITNTNVIYLLINCPKNIKDIITNIKKDYSILDRYDSNIDNSQKTKTLIMTTITNTYKSYGAIMYKDLVTYYDKPSNNYNLICYCKDIEEYEYICEFADLMCIKCYYIYLNNNIYSIRAN